MKSDQLNLIRQFKTVISPVQDPLNHCKRNNNEELGSLLFRQFLYELVSLVNELEYASRVIAVHVSDEDYSRLDQHICYLLYAPEMIVYLRVSSIGTVHQDGTVPIKDIDGAHIPVNV